MRTILLGIVLLWLVPSCASQKKTDQFDEWLEDYITGPLPRDDGQVDPCLFGPAPM
jgi:hypothetical protein